MIIISNKPGRLGNLLIIYSGFLAYGLETGTVVINPSFYEYHNYFSGTSGFSFSCNKVVYKISYVVGRILFKCNIKTKFINVVALDWVESVNLESEKSLTSIMCFVQGWLFRSNALLLKHRKYILDFFSPNTLLKSKLDNFFSDAFPKNVQFIIGVHIRRGDYKTFEDGKYFYNLHEYVTVLKQVEALFENRRLHFLICSNEVVDVDEFSELKSPVSLAMNHELLDMYSLARCHYIIGPPSTYSMWASFYGNVPLYMMDSLNKKISLEDFKVQLHF